MVNFSQFNKTDDVAYNILTALEYCKQNNEDGLVFDKDTYHVYEEKATQGVYSMSNHTNPGIKKACFLLKGMKNFVLDGCGSTFIMEDILTPVILDECDNIKIKGFSFSAKNTLNSQLRIVKSGDGWIETKTETGNTFVYNGCLYAGFYDGEEYNPESKKNKCEKLYHFFEYDSKFKLREGVPAYTIFGDADVPVISYTDEGYIRFDNLKRNFDEGNHLVFISLSRCCASIFLNESKNIEISDTILYSGIGMGVIAQNCENIEIHDFSTKLKDNRCYSINADATHFVHCKGLISVHDCTFDSQLDDALNIHSLYLKIIQNTGNKLLLKYMHHESKGIDIFKEGGILQVSDAETLLPYKEFKIVKTTKVNYDYVEVEVEGDVSSIKTGDVADEISYVPDVIFENNTMCNIRSRGMLLASAGKIVVKNNVFNISGTAIKFESDGKFWFESGRTRDVLISNNKFIRCKRSKWGDAVIEVSPREKTEENKYYHGKIEISDNTFVDCGGYAASVNNADTFVFNNNEINNISGEVYKIFHIKNKVCDIE